MTSEVNLLARLIVTMLMATALQPIAHGQDVVDATLARVYSEYVAARTRSDIARLVQIDQELRRIFPAYHDDGYVAPNGRHYIEATYLRPGYEALGLSGAVFEPDVLTYSGKVLREAHTINSRSAYRRYTLYSTVFPDAKDAGPFPDFDAARAYVREFPQGPFAADAYLELGHFRDDLFKVIRGILANDVPDYKQDCFAPYLTKQPYRDQLRAAQNSGVANYRRVLALRPTDQRAREGLAELSKGTSEEWSFCPD
jgi:hypothetical protein